jgi:acetylornithine deacetylase/succinyl-diaminopimelate desuccinylase-like protein
VSASSALIAHVEARRADILDFTRELIAAPSPTPPGDERAVAHRVLHRLDGLGLTGSRTVGPRAERPSVLWTLAGTGKGRRIVLNGHLDTKPVGDTSHWLTDPFVATECDGQLYGLGSSDMKGAVAAMVYAAAAVRDVLGPLRGDVTLALTADEEGGCADGAAYLLEHQLVEADAILIGEPAGMTREWEWLYVVSRGLTAVKVRVYGTQMHSSISDILPSVNASTRMAWVLDRMARTFSIPAPAHPYCQQGVTVNPGVTVRGGVQYGVTPGYAEFGTDIRIPPGVSLDDVRQALDAFFIRLRSEMPDLQATWEFEPPPLEWMPPTEIAVDDSLVRAVVSAAEQVLGQAPPFGTFPGGTEAAFYQGRAGIPCLPAFGPGFLPICHGPNEHVGVESIIQAAKMYAIAAAQAAG